MYELKNDLAAIIAEAQAGTDVLVTRHNKPVARLTRASVDHLHIGASFGDADLKPAVSMPRSLDLAHLRTAIWFHGQEKLARFVSLDEHQAISAREPGLPV